VIILSVVTLSVLTWFVISYNFLVRDRTRVLTAWSDIEVQLKRRHDLIPKLVEVVKRYAAYESATLSAVTALRAESDRMHDVAGKGEVEGRLGDKIRALVAVAEGYPELKASHSYLDLQHNLTEVEKNLQYARRYYNGAVRNLNVRVSSFPDFLVARLFNFKPAQFFKFESGASGNDSD
jgi:LemA protein